MTGASRLTAWLSGLALAGLAAGAALADEPTKITVTAVGRPPISSNTFPDVAMAEGYFKDAGLDPTMRWFQRANDTAKAILTGDADVGWTASVVGLNLMASGAPVVAIAGMNTQDWIVASDDPSVTSCENLKGQTVAADGINNARYLFLGQLAATCQVGLADMQLLNVANAALVKAGIAGQVNTAVFHVDELAQVEFKSGKSWHVLPAPASIAKGLHYGMILTTKKEVAENREALVRFLMVWIRTQRFMSSPDQKAAFAAIMADAVKVDPKVATNAIDGLQAIHYWADGEGLDKGQMASQIDQLVKIGTIKPETRPAYEAIVDTSLYAEAVKRLGAK